MRLPCDFKWARASAIREAATSRSTSENDARMFNINLSIATIPVSGDRGVQRNWRFHRGTPRSRRGIRCCQLRQQHVRRGRDRPTEPRKGWQCHRRPSGRLEADGLCAPSISQLTGLHLKNPSDYPITYHHRLCDDCLARAPSPVDHFRPKAVLASIPFALSKIRMASRSARASRKASLKRTSLVSAGR